AIRPDARGGALRLLQSVDGAGGPRGAADFRLACRRGTGSTRMAADARAPLSAECSRVQSDVSRLAAPCACQGQQAAAWRGRVGVQRDDVSAADCVGHRGRTRARVRPLNTGARPIGALAGSSLGVQLYSTWNNSDTRI